MQQEDSLNRIKQIAVLTGSRAFNVHRKDSDYDFIITTVAADSLNSDFIPCKHLVDSANPKCKDDDYDYNLYGDDLIDIVRFTNSEGYDINLFIFKNDSVYDKFKQVNQYMLETKLDIKDKDIRIKEWIVALEMFDISTYEEPNDFGDDFYRRG